MMTTTYNVQGVPFSVAKKRKKYHFVEVIGDQVDVELS